MHPFRTILQRRAAAKHADDLAQFLRNVDFCVELFNLDPNLPEIMDLKRDAEHCVDMPMMWLSWLNPKDDIRHDGDTLVVMERWFGHVLHPWTLADHNIGYPIGPYVARIVADKSGTHLFDSRGREVVRFEAGVLNPHRFADPGNRLVNAAAIINRYTGLDIDWHDFVGQTSVELVRQEDGSWTKQLVGA